MKYLEKRPMIMVVIGLIGVSLSSIFVKYSAAPSAVTAAFRLIWTVLLLAPVALGRPECRAELRKMGRRNILLSMVSGVFLALHFWLWFESLSHTSVASSTTIVCTEVIWVSLGFCLFMKGTLSKKAVAAILLTLAGSILVASADSASGKAQFYGDILALLAAVAVAVYTLIGKHVRKSVSTTAYTFVVYTMCACVLMIIVAVQKQQMFAYGASAPLVGLLLAVFCTIFGHSVFNWCLKYFSPSFVSASRLCEPVVAAILASFLFGELPGKLQLLGGAIILCGVLYYSRIEKPDN